MKILRSFFCLFFLVLPGLFGKPWHKYYLSMTEIEVNQTTKVLKISCRLFTDDLERSVRSQSLKGLHPEHSALNQASLKPYFLKHFSIWQSGKLQTSNVIGVEQDVDVTWVYIEVPYTSKSSDFRLVNTLLYDQLSEQVNLVVVKSNNSKQNFRLSYPDSLVNFSSKAK